MGRAVTPRNAKGRFAASADPAHQRRRETEAAIQRTFCQMLRLYAGPRVNWHSIPNEGSRTRTETMRLMAQGLTPGAADMLVHWPGQMLYIEFKAPGQAQKDDQVTFQARAEAAGAIYRVFHSWEMAWLALDAMDAPILKTIAGTDPLRLIDNPRLRQADLMRAAE